jgi:hypothetical protein
MPDLEMRQLIHRFIENRLERQLATGSTKLKMLGRSAEAFPAAHQKVLQQRLKKLSQWHDRTRALLPVARAFPQARRLTAGPAQWPQSTHSFPARLLRFQK